MFYKQQDGLVLRLRTGCCGMQRRRLGKRKRELEPLKKQSIEDEGSSEEKDNED